LSVVILAGGHSVRMGRDKALLPLPDGETFLSNTVQVAQALSEEVWIVTPWPQRYRSLLSGVKFVQEPSFGVPQEPQWPAESGEFAPNHRNRVKEQNEPGAAECNEMRRNRPSAGPLSGFLWGWQAVASDWCLLLPCDMPNLQTSVLRTWWRWIVQMEQSHWMANRTESNLLDRINPLASLAPGIQLVSSWEPFCGFYHRRCVAGLSRHLMSGSRSFQSWLKTMPIAIYENVPSAMFWNCNSPADVFRNPAREIPLESDGEMPLESNSGR
ncbi:MAG: NTP transferase domain-containing protein, partial [Cyanobacteria bacterium J06632_3]